MEAVLLTKDADYRAWLSSNRAGFVLNTGRPLPPNYMVLHRASCPHISEPTHESEPGGFTERGYVKVVAADVDCVGLNPRAVKGHLVGKVVVHRPPARSPWARCHFTIQIRSRCSVPGATRYALGCAHLRGKLGQITATDSHQLLVLE